MQTAIIYQSPTWELCSIGNGWAYELRDKRPGNKTLWFQDDDATAFRERHDALEQFYMAKSGDVFFDKVMSELWDMYS